MHKFMKSIFPALMAIFILAVPLEAQKKAKDARAQAAFDAGEYYKAIDLYKDAYNKVDREQKTAIFFKVGECYRIIGDARSASLWYTKAIREDYQDPVIYLRYGQMLLVNEKYPEAEKDKIIFKALDSLLSNCLFKLLDLVGFFPCEVRIFPTKMTIRCCLLIYWTSQLKLF